MKWLESNKMFIISLVVAQSDDRYQVKNNEALKVFHNKRSKHNVMRSSECIYVYVQWSTTSVILPTQHIVLKNIWNPDKNVVSLNGPVFKLLGP